MIPAEDTTTLSLLYHLNSEPWLNEDAYRQAAAYEVSYKRVASPEARIELPKPAETALAALLRQRSSCRAFQRRGMPVETLAALLAAAYGITEVSEFADGSSWLRRSVPSAGGLFPLEIYAVTQRVDGAADGLHHYDVREHALETVRRGFQMSELGNELLAYPFVQDANVLFLITGVFQRTQKKYGPRGYRYILLEAGHVAQNVCLAGTELGLATLCIGGFMDGGVNRSLGLQPTEEAVVYAVGCGYPSPPARPSPSKNVDPLDPAILPG